MAYLGLNQPERAQAALVLALKANPGISVEASEFTPAVAALFAGARAPAAASPEAAGQAAEQAGRFQDAFLAYLSAFQSLSDPLAPADDRRLRERIMTVVQKLPTKPVVPQEARAHLTTAEGILAADAALGGSGGPAAQQAALTELRQAVRIAPWWPEPLFNLASVLQKLQQFDLALFNLNLYRLADPAGFLARTTPAPAAAPVAAGETPVRRTPASAVLYVYYVRGARSAMRCDGLQLAELESGRFAKVNVPPGSHTIKVRDSEIEADFASNATVYLRFSRDGYPARYRLRVMNADEAAEEIRRRDIVANDPQRTFSGECTP
jgi:hypothetical protein